MYIVNKLALQVRPFESGYLLNYMAFFESEVVDETLLTHTQRSGTAEEAWPTIDAAQVTFAHMLHTTEYYCYLATDGGCACYAFMDPHPNKWNRSALLDTLSRQTLPDPTCRTLAGSYPPRSGEAEAEVALGGDAHAAGSSCVRFAPPDRSTVRATGSREYVSIPVVVCCEGFGTGGTKGVRVRMQSSAFNATSHSDAASDEHGCFSLTPAITAAAFTSYRSAVSFEVSLGHSSQGDAFFFASSFEIELIMTSRAPSAAFSVAANPLLTGKSVALASQLQLHELLNERQLSDGPGLVVGAESAKGQQAVLNLITGWQGDTLILLVRSDDVSRGASAAEQQRSYEAACLSAGRRCVVKALSLADASPLALLRAMRPMKMSFAFVDVAAEYSVQLRLLQGCSELLLSGGVLLGSSLNKAHSRGRGDVRRLNARSVLDALVPTLGAALMTHDEADDAFCRQLGECSASYYFFKM